MQARKMREGKWTLCRDLYAVVVLTSTAAVGSITSAARSRRRKEELRLQHLMETILATKEEVQIVMYASASAALIHAHVTPL